MWSNVTFLSIKICDFAALKEDKYLFLRTVCNYFILRLTCHQRAVVSSSMCDGHLHSSVVCPHT